MSGSSNLNSFRDRRQVAVQLVSCGVLPAGLVQDCTQHSCVIAVYIYVCVCVCVCVCVRVCVYTECGSKIRKIQV